MYAKSGIRCNIIMPGGMATNIASAFAAGINQTGYEVVMRQQGATESPTCPLDQVGKVAAFVCSDGAGVINGSQVSADSGWSAY